MQWHHLPPLPSPLLPSTHPSLMTSAAQIADRFKFNQGRMTGREGRRNADSGTPPTRELPVLNCNVAADLLPPPLPTHSHTPVHYLNVASLFSLAATIFLFIHSFICLSVYSFISPAAFTALGLPEQQYSEKMLLHVFCFFSVFFLSFSLHLHVPFHQRYSLILLAVNGQHPP